MDGSLIAWLDSLGLSEHLETFHKNDVDMEVIRHLTDSDLRELGLSLGQRRRFLAAAAKLPADITAGDRDRARPGGTVTGERRVLTAVFIDIVNSVGLGQSMDPEELHDLIRRFQGAVAGATIRYDGYVAKFIGDGALAYFGWPQAHEDEAERAVRAARDALTAIRAIRSETGPALEVRVGIATGEVVFGGAGDAVAGDTEPAVGTAFALAERLQRAAHPYQIVIGPRTRWLLGDVFELEDLGALELKGFHKPVRAWRVAGEGAAESRFQAAHAGALSPFVARQGERAHLRERWRLAKSGEGQVVALAGEAGIGKSRLLSEFRQEIGDDPRFGFRYQCSPYHSSSAFHPVIQQLRRTAGIAEDDPPEMRRSKIGTLLDMTLERSEAALPFFAELLRIPGPEVPRTMPAQQIRQRQIACLVDQVVSMSRRHPVVAVVEDAHWADPSTLEYVGALAAAIAKNAVLLIVTFRPEFSPDWPEGTPLTTITLGGIQAQPARALVHGVAHRKVTAKAVSKIVERAQGNPLFIEELTRAVVESGEPARNGERAVPLTLQGSLTSRLDALGGARQVAQIGSVIGREFPHPLLEHLAAHTGVPLGTALDRLLGSGLVTRNGTPPEAVYSFKHALVQDAAYNMLLLSRRRELHQLIVDKLEAELERRTRADLELLGRHAQGAENWEQAFRYFGEAGQEAARRSSVREAAELFRRALDCARPLPRSPELLRELVAVLFELRNALWTLGRFEDILPYLDDAEGIAQELEDQALAGWVSVYRGASLWQLGRSEHARAAAARGREIGIAAGVGNLEVAANFYLGCRYVTAGECHVAEEYFRRVVDALPGERAMEKCGLPFAPSLISQSWLIWSLAERGEFDAAEQYAERATEAAARSGVPFNMAHVAYDVGYMKLVRSDFDGAIETLEQARALIVKWGLTYLSPFTTGFLGTAYARGGQLEHGLDLLRQALRHYDEIALGLFRSLVGGFYAGALRAAGRLDEASAILERALELARRRGERGHEAHGLLVLGDIAAATTGAEDVEAAREVYEAALARANELDMIPLAAQCHLALARILSQDDAEVGEDRHMRHARNLHRKLGLSLPINRHS